MTGVVDQHPASLSASRRTTNYGRYIEDIVGRLETVSSGTAGLQARSSAAPDKNDTFILRSGLKGRVSKDGHEHRVRCPSFETLAALAPQG
jgi:hypothetical protein